MNDEKSNVPPFGGISASGEHGFASSFEDVVSELSAALVRASADEVPAAIERQLRHVVLSLNIDRATIGEIDPTDGVLYATHQWAREGVMRTPPALNANQVLPWATGKILADETVVLSRLEDAPPEAAKDVEFARMAGVKSTVLVPLRIGKAVVGAVTFGAVNRAHTWSPRTVQRLRLIAELFGHALERQRTVTEIRRLRDEMEQTSRVAMMGELTASLTHELNQPLGAILSNAQAARRFLTAKRPNLAEARAAIEEIIHDNSRAAQTLRNVRALFQPNQVEMSALDLRHTLLEAERLLSAEADGKGISMVIDLPSSLPTVLGNRMLLLEVLINLTANAFDSICEEDAGPRVVVLCARRCETGHVQVAVRDSGKGIDPKTMPRLFDAFFTTKPHGMGIGLRVARSIIETHGGRLWATRNPDRGATLQFELPVAEGA